MTGRISKFFHDVNNDAQEIISQTVFRARGKNFAELTPEELPPLSLLAKAYGRVGAHHLKEALADVHFGSGQKAEIFSPDGQKIGSTTYQYVSISDVPSIDPACE